MEGKKDEHVIDRLRIDCDLGPEHAPLGHSFSLNGPPSRQIAYVSRPKYITTGDSAV